jgi:argonaute-like protein implicated in RNA metabolism and viral defense
MRQFGYLVDFHFRLRDGIPFSKKIQQLSLSLNRSFRRNLDYYVDRSSRLQAFIKERDDVLRSLRVPGQTDNIVLGEDLVALPADRLRTKVYVFSGKHESKSQFNGLRDYGPLQPLGGALRLLFIFRERDKLEARKLALSLRGTRQRERFSFPGFNALFKCDVQIDSNPVILPDLTRAAIETALERVRCDKDGEPNTVPVVVLPADDDSYLIQKALFSQAGIPTQVCTLRILQDEDSLKWAIANLALQIFCKAGGYPWKVRPTSDRSLIIGISQSHKIRKDDGLPRVEKYFAFSVMTDNSGLFQKIQVLGEDPNESDYLAKLRQSLGDVLKESAGQFSRVVVHTSFKLKYREIDAIQKTVRNAATTAELAECKFAVVKVNHKSRFFGVNRGVNSLVPFEATRVKLGPREYLVWFEGIFPDRPTVTKAFPGPTHLQILRMHDERGIPDEVLLQDLVNLSGANWRGFNAKSAPVSVFYCHLVADLVHNFHERGLPLPAVRDIRPWFL